MLTYETLILVAGRGARQLGSRGRCTDLREVPQPMIQEAYRRSLRENIREVPPCRKDFLSQILSVSVPS